MKKLLSLFFILACTSARAQLPDTDIWLFKLVKDKEKGVILKDPLNVTQRKGYDNQPSFSADEKKIYYVSIRDDKQADIYFYDLKGKKNVRLSNSMAESEYSPVPTEDGRFLTSVTVENDSSQRIHFINAETGNYDHKYDVDSVGYYTFLNADTVVYYKLTEPHSLRYYVDHTKEDNKIASAPIRTFKAVNRHTLIYGTKDSVKVTFFKYNFFLGKAEKYCEYPSLNEDVIWHNTLGLVKSEHDKLYNYHEQKKQWVLLYDLSSFGIKKITRFVFDPKGKYLVLVNNL